MCFISKDNIWSQIINNAKALPFCGSLNASHHAIWITRSFLICNLILIITPFYDAKANYAFKGS